MSNAYTPSSCRISSNSGRLKGGRSTGVAAAIAGVAICALLLGPAARALPEDADQPIHIRADNVEYDQNGNRVIYRGSVQVDQGTLRVTAETLTIDLQDGKKVLRITAEDTPAHYQQQVEEGKDLVRARALTIIYHTQDERVDLKGEANLEQEGSTLTGDLIVYDIVAGRVDATAEREEPVRMVLQPAVTKSASAQTKQEPAPDAESR